METLLRKLNDARNKELILHYLRYHKIDRVDTLKVRNEVFGEPFSYQKVQKYFQDMVKDGLVDSVEDSSIIWNNDDSFEFIESGGYVKKLFVEEKLIFDEKKFIQAHHKDLILCMMIYAGIGNWEIVHLSTMLFPKYEDETMRNYSDEFFEKGYVKQGNSNASIQYKKEAIAFIDEGGYTGQYLMKLKQQAEQESEEAQKLSKKRKEIADKKERTDNLKITISHFFLFGYGRWIIVAAILIVFYLIIKGVIPLGRAIDYILSKF